MLFKIEVYLIVAEAGRLWKYDIKMAASVIMTVAFTPMTASNSWPAAPQ